MRFSIQQYQQSKDSRSIPAIFVELVQEMDLPILFANGYIQLDISDEAGEPAMNFFVYLKGRGFNPEAIKVRKSRGGSDNGSDS